MRPPGGYGGKAGQGPSYIVANGMRRIFLGREKI